MNLLFKKQTNNICIISTFALLLIKNQRIEDNIGEKYIGRKQERKEK
jgi:hypothetical protein